MPTGANPHSVAALEAKILRALCSEPATSTDRANTLARLNKHHWQGPEHRVVFEALTLLPNRELKELREQLPAQATRMGFPDVAWEEYFAPEIQNTDPEVLLKELQAATQNEKS
jgi:hypothetical protein